MPPQPPDNQRQGRVLAAAVAAFLAGVAAVALVLFLASAVTGFADGDPPSDYLLTQQVYLPINAPSAASGDRLKALVAAANDDGYTIRVAVIQAPQDLGSIPQLMGKPRTYAKFLGAELAFAYKGRLLTVMSNGYGISQNGGKRVPNGYQQLRSVAAPGRIVSGHTDRCRQRGGAQARRPPTATRCRKTCRRLRLFRAVVYVGQPHRDRGRRTGLGRGDRCAAWCSCSPAAGRDNGLAPFFRLGDWGWFFGDRCGRRLARPGQQPVARDALEPGSGGE